MSWGIKLASLGGRTSTLEIEHTIPEEEEEEEEGEEDPTGRYGTSSCFNQKCRAVALARYAVHCIHRAAPPNPRNKATLTAQRPRDCHGGEPSRDAPVDAPVAIRLAQHAQHSEWVFFKSHFLEVLGSSRVSG
jgi:hypothetical protein